MSRPLIGISLNQADDPGRYELGHNYAAAVERGGGVPVHLPFRCDVALIDEYLDRLDGLLLAGGKDLCPSLYGSEPRHPKTTPLDPYRQRFDLAMLAEADRRAMPVFGICLGAQMMNVSRGGSLYQFLPDVLRDNALEHRHLNGVITRHAVQLHGTSSILAQCIGKSEMSVNTYHKQAVRTLGGGMKETSIAPDGVIESFEDPDRPLFLGVQWHPEKIHSEPDQLKLFELLVERASHYR